MVVIFTRFVVVIPWENGFHTTNCMPICERACGSWVTHMPSVGMLPQPISWGEWVVTWGVLATWISAKIESSYFCPSLQHLESRGCPHDGVDPCGKPFSLLLPWHEPLAILVCSHYTEFRHKLCLNMCRCMCERMYPYGFVQLSYCIHRYTGCTLVENYIWTTVEVYSSTICV